MHMLPARFPSLRALPQNQRVVQRAEVGASRTSRCAGVTAAATAERGEPGGAASKAPSSMSKLGQNVNTVGISLFFKVLWGDRQLAVPHASVPDIRWLDWQALREAGFKGCVFDKDGTLSAPFALEVDARIKSALDNCLTTFGANNVVLYSNSAGLKQYDPEGREASHLEAALGVHVLRHATKKPGGSSSELEEHFGCSASQLVMIGDRYLTDVVFGNRHGMMTVYVQPLSTAGEPAGVVAARTVENMLVQRWSSHIQAPAHGLLRAHEQGAGRGLVQDPAVK